MSNPEPNIRINVDVTNPGQFFRVLRVVGIGRSTVAGGGGML